MADIILSRVTEKSQSNGTEKLLIEYQDNIYRMPLSEIVNNSGSSESVQIDDTLTLSGYAADAAAVGELAKNVAYVSDEIYEETAAILNADKLNGKTESELHVADANTLGGKAPEYYIQSRNLLDNSDFTNPVNQRGKTSYTSGYAIDRWKIPASETTSLTVDSDGITVAANGENGYLFHHIIATSNLIGKTLTAAVCLKDGTIYTFGNGIVSTISPSTETQIGTRTSTDNGVNLALFSSTNKTIMIQIKVPYGVSLELKWAALYEGDYTAETLPPYIPKGYGVELVECQRYYQRHFVNFKYNEYYSYLPISVPMRVIPSATIIESYGNTIPEVVCEANVCVYAMFPNSVGEQAQEDAWADAWIALSADL